jgi:hypothetical protein
VYQNPTSIAAQQSFFNQPAFVNYLKYLTYWKSKDHARFILYVQPTALPWKLASRVPDIRNVSTILTCCSTSSSGSRSAKMAGENTCIASKYASCLLSVPSRSCPCQAEHWRTWYETTEILCVFAAHVSPFKARICSDRVQR